MCFPGIPIVTELVRRGHDVHWYVGAKFRSKAEQAGATFEPYVHALDYDDADYDAAFPQRKQLSGLRQVTYDFRKAFVEQMEGQHRDLTAILERFPADVTLGDPAMIGPVSVNERGGPPNAIYNITCLGVPGRGIAPFGPGGRPGPARQPVVPRGRGPGRRRARRAPRGGRQRRPPGTTGRHRPACRRLRRTAAGLRVEPPEPEVRPPRI